MNCTLKLILPEPHTTVASCSERGPGCRAAAQRDPIVPRFLVFVKRGISQTYPSRDVLLTTKHGAKRDTLSPELVPCNWLTLP